MSQQIQYLGLLILQLLHQDDLTSPAAIGGEEVTLLHVALACQQGTQNIRAGVAGDKAVKVGGVVDPVLPYRNAGQAEQAGLD
jgi:hypothetical protein